MVTSADSGLRQQQHTHQSTLLKHNFTLITSQSSVSTNVIFAQSSLKRSDDVTLYVTVLEMLCKSEQRGYYTKNIYIL